MGRDTNKPLGSFDIIGLFNQFQCWPQEYKNSEVWKPSRPLPFHSLKERFKMAWDILVYKADALYW